LSRWWFAAPHVPTGNNGGGDQQEAPVREADFIVLPAAASDAWRTWLMTGSRKPPFDRRRIRGAHKGLKKMLIEGTATPDDRAQPWNDFSSAMVRQAVDEALNSLPPGHKQALKLAYFGGFSNWEIAKHLGVGEGEVSKRLRDALAAVSAHVEVGRAAARHTVYGIAGWFSLRSIADFFRRAPAHATDHVVQAAVVLACGVATASVLAGQVPSPAQLTQIDGGSVTSSAPVTGSVLSLSPSHVLPVTVSVSPPVAITLPEPTSLPAKVPDPGTGTLPVTIRVPPIRLHAFPKYI
jgi:RNA polymerase sigma factor (sigma-70 family)